MQRINCYIPIKLRITGRLSDAQLDQFGESLVRTLGRAFAHTRRELPAADVLGRGVVLARPELVKGNLAPEERAALLNLLGRAIEQAASNQGLPTTVAPQAGQVPGGATPTMATISLSQAVSEPLDLARFDATSGTYLLPSYKKGKTRVPIALGRDPFAKPSAAQMRAAARDVKPPAPIDWDTVWKALHDTAPINRWNAFAKIRDLVEAGDKQAVTYGLSAIRADGGTPTTDILTALRTLATRHPARFRQVLRAIRADQRASFGGQEVTRNPDDYRVDTRYFGLLDVLGGLARALSDIPAAQTLGLELERETKGLARVNGLIAAVIEARRALEAYLIEPRPTTTVQLLTHAFRGVAPDVPEQTDPAVVGKIRNITNRLPRIVGLVLAGLNDPEWVYDLQNDLVEHHRWTTGTLAGVQRIDWRLSMYRLLYGDVMDQLEEVKALRESRSHYLTAVAEHPFPAADRIAQLRRDTDAFAADWYGRAASAKFGHWAGLAAEIAKVAKSLKSLDLVVPDSYNRRLMETLGAFASLQRQLSAVRAFPRGPELLARMSEIDREFPLLAIHVNFCLLWYAAHELMRVFTDKSIGDDDDRAHWRKMLGMICKQIEEQFDKPNMWRLQDNLKS